LNTSSKHAITNTNEDIHKTDATKNDSSYAVVPLPNMLKNELRQWRIKQIAYSIKLPKKYNSEGYVCTQKDGSLIKPNYATQHFKRLLKKENLPVIRFHDLRHSAACYLKYLGFDLKDIQVWLRHKDIQTTMNIYVNLDMTEKSKIEDSLDEKFAKFGA